MLTPHADSNPTREVNGFATTNCPPVTPRGSAGRFRGAGPSTTRAASLGSNFEEWHEQYKTCSSGNQSAISQPECVQMAVYATTPSAAIALVSALSCCGSILIRSTRFRREPL